MYNTSIPDDRTLPSTAKLIKSTIWAAITAVILLVTVVMPAEYGIDPTGIGQAIGLKKMGEIKVSLAEEAVEPDRGPIAGSQTTVVASNNQLETMLQAPISSESIVQKNLESILAKTDTKFEPLRDLQVDVKSDQMIVTLTPNQGTEIKVGMKQGARTSYEWWTNGGKASFDIHGDSAELNIDYHGYGKGSSSRESGELVAEFDGSHGWYWRNRTDAEMTIVLKTTGDYSGIRHIK